MLYCGFLDSVTLGKARGWAAHITHSEPVLVEILAANGAVLAEGRADRYREDLKFAGIHEGAVGFEIELPAGFWVKSQLSARIKETDFTLVNRSKFEAQCFLERFMNSTISGIPVVPTGFSVHDIDDTDVAIARELIEYSRSMTLPEKSGEGSRSMWETHEAENFASFLAPLKEGVAEAVARAIIDCPKTNVSLGMLQGAESYYALVNATDKGRNSYAALDFDALLAFAQYLGVERLESPEQITFGDALHLEPVRVLSRVEERLGFSIVPPQMVDGLVGFSTPSGILHSRDVQGLYLAHRTVSSAGRKSSVCEIGGGLSKAAYYAWNLGIRKYTVVDLPIGCLLQYFFLRRSIPDARVAIAPKSGDITIIPASLFARYAGKYDIAINSDSFPEMGDDICQAYFDSLSKRTRLLLSINQEANCPLGADVNGARQSVVSELLERHDAYQRVYRQYSWVRKGYAEELWRSRRRFAPRTLMNAIFRTRSV